MATLMPRRPARRCDDCDEHRILVNEPEYAMQCRITLCACGAGGSLLRTVGDSFTGRVVHTIQHSYTMPELLVHYDALTSDRETGWYGHPQQQTVTHESCGGVVLSEQFLYQVVGMT